MNTNTHKVTVGKVVQYLILILMFLLLVGPFVWELSLSFKGKGDNVYAVPPYLMPKTPTLENYISVFKQVPVFHYMLNTLVVCLISIFGNVTFLHDGRLRTGTPEVAWPRTGVHHVHGAPWSSRSKA